MGTSRAGLPAVGEFDPERNAVLLVAGDKSGQWSEWYRRSIPLAEVRYAQWLAYLEQRREGE